MNNYLIMLASNLQQIRGLLTLTQENLANALGISRPTLVKIEQDPTKLTKTMSFALYVVVSSEFQRTKERIDNLNPEDYVGTKNLPKFLMDIQQATSLTSSSLGGIAALTASTANIPGISNMINIGLKKGFEFIKKKGVPLPDEETIWNREMVEEWMKKAEETVMNKENECLQYFKLDQWDTLKFLNKVESSDIDN